MTLHLTENPLGCFIDYSKVTFHL